MDTTGNVKAYLLWDQLMTLIIYADQSGADARTLNKIRSNRVDFEVSFLPSSILYRGEETEDENDTRRPSLHRCMPVPRDR